MASPKSTLSSPRPVSHLPEEWAHLIRLFHSSSSSKAISHAAHVFHCIVAGLEIDLWVEHVKSKANIADIPSRMRTFRSHPQQHGFLKLDLVESTARFPSPEEWAHPIKLFHSLKCRYSRANPERY